MSSFLIRETLVVSYPQEEKGQLPVKVPSFVSDSPGGCVLAGVEAGLHRPGILADLTS